MSVVTSRSARAALLFALCAVAHGVVGCAPRQASLRAAAPVATPASSAPSAVAPAQLACPAQAPALADEATEPQLPPGLRVGRVCIFGAVDELGPEVESVLAVRAGDLLTSNAVRDAFDRLARIDGIFDVRLGAEVLGDRAVMHVVVRARPRVTEVVFEPASARPPEGTTVIERRTPPHLVAEYARVLESHWRRKGYGDARVVAALEPVGPGTARVRVKVDAGPAWTVAQVSFVGAKQVSEAALRAAARLPIGASFRAEDLDDATPRIWALLADHGLVDAVMPKVATDVDAQGHVRLTWTLHEGTVHRFSMVALVGPIAPADLPKLRALLESSVAQPVRPAVIGQDLQRIRAYYATRSQEVEVTPSTEIDAKAHTCTLTFTVTPK